MNTTWFERLVMAYNTVGNVADFFFHLGCQGFVLPRWFKNVMVKTVYHRAWHSGYYGGGILNVIQRSESFV